MTAPAPLFHRRKGWTDEYATPKWLYDHYDAEFGFTVDACAQGWNAKHQQYIAPAIDGLTQQYPAEVVWCNPPYSDIPSWLKLAYTESVERGATWVCLVPCYPDRKWWADWVEGKAEIRLHTRNLLPSGRVHFEREDGTANRAGFPTSVVIYRPRVAEFGPPVDVSGQESDAVRRALTQRAYGSSGHQQ